MASLGLNDLIHISSAQPVTRTEPELIQCCQHQCDSSPVLAQKGCWQGLEWHAVSICLVKWSPKVIVRWDVDSFTVPLHSRNGRRKACHKGCARGLSVTFECGGNSHWSCEPTDTLQITHNPLQMRFPPVYIKTIQLKDMSHSLLIILQPQSQGCESVWMRCAGSDRSPWGCLGNQASATKYQVDHIVVIIIISFKQVHCWFSGSWHQL